MLGKGTAKNTKDAKGGAAANEELAIEDVWRESLDEGEMALRGDS
jgi:hypothetical protein